jgi:hypothetical protein
MTERQRIVETLRATMLRCLLDESPLPGTSEAVRFPDFRFITEAEDLILSGDDLSDEFEFEEAERPATVMTESAIRSLAEEEGDRFYVYFQPPHWENERVRIPVEVRLAPADPDVMGLSLGGVSAVFEWTGTEWVVVEGPVVMAG